MLGEVIYVGARGGTLLRTYRHASIYGDLVSPASDPFILGNLSNDVRPIMYPVVFLFFRL